MINCYLLSYEHKIDANNESKTSTQEFGFKKNSTLFTSERKDECGMIVDDDVFLFSVAGSVILVDCCDFTT